MHSTGHITIRLTSKWAGIFGLMMHILVGLRYQMEMAGEWDQNRNIYREYVKRRI